MKSDITARLQVKPVLFMTDFGSFYDQFQNYYNWYYNLMFPSAALVRLKCQVITEISNVAVTQGAATGTLKTALNGASTSVVIETASGVTFLDSADVVIVF